MQIPSYVHYLIMNYYQCKNSKRYSEQDIKQISNVIIYNRLIINVYTLENHYTYYLYNGFVNHESIYVLNQHPIKVQSSYAIHNIVYMNINNVKIYLMLQQSEARYNRQYVYVHQATNEIKLLTVKTLRKRCQLPYTESIINNLNTLIDRFNMIKLLYTYS